MESLNALANSLPNTNSLANSEKELLNNFKAAALSITTLYRSSRQTSKRAYNAGYGAACQDLLLMIQQGVSVGGDANPSSNEAMGNGMTIGKVMDWIEARLEAIKSREEEEDEEEEKERAKSTAGSQSTTSTLTSKPSGSVAKSRPPESSSGGKHKEQLAVVPTTLTAPPAAAPHIPPLSLPPSPSSPSASLHTTRPIHYMPSTRAPKSRVPFPASGTPDVFKFGVDGMTAATAGGGGLSGDGSGGYGIDLVGLGAGAKRRHAVMMMLDSAPSSVDLTDDVDFPLSLSGSPSAHPVSTMCTGPGMTTTSMTNGRRRTRSARSNNHAHGGHTANGNQYISDAMDVEEEGRERKRVARR